MKADELSNLSRNVGRPRTVKRVAAAALVLAFGCASDFETRVYRVDRAVFFPVEEEIVPASASGGSGKFVRMGPGTNAPPISLDENFRDFFRTMGVPFPQGAVLRVNTNDLTITVRNTHANNDRFEHVWGQISGLHRAK